MRGGDAPGLLGRGAGARVSGLEVLIVVAAGIVGGLLVAPFYGYLYELGYRLGRREGEDW